MTTMFTPETLASRIGKALRPAAALRLWLGVSLFVLAAQPLQAQFDNLPEDGFPDGAINRTVEERVEESVEEAVIDNLSDRVLSLGGFPAGYIESRIEESIADRVLSLGGFPAGYIEQLVEESVEEQVADNVEESIQDNVTDNIQDVVEETVAEAISENLEEALAENIEDEIVDNVEDIVEETVTENLEDNIELGIEGQLEFELAQAAESGMETSIEGEIDELLQNIESDIEINESRIHTNQWLVMAETEVFDELEAEGYLFDKVTDLPGLGMRLAEVAAPSSFSISEARQGVMDVVGSERAKVDLNHIYTAGAKHEPSSGVGVLPRSAITVPSDTDDLVLRIGMIDSLVDTSHPSLDSSNIQSRSFAPEDSEMPDFHGTAIASILAANSPDYQGLAPNAEIFAAAVFEKNIERGEFASTVSLVRALDWLVTSGVDVVNISLAGPPNRLLEAALKHAAKGDVLVVAAAGNGGPVAKPMYPAAYDSVVAVTAVDSQGQVFRLANRGQYLDLAAPGVDLQHARAGGGYAASSGTSFAVPFAATAAARIRQLRPAENARESLNQSAEDLGDPGHDEVYGYGLLRLATNDS